MIRAMLTLAFTVALLGAAAGQEREENVRKDRQKVGAEGFWIYNDFSRGVTEAKQSGKEEKEDAAL